MERSGVVLGGSDRDETLAAADVAAESDGAPTTAASPEALARDRTDSTTAPAGAQRVSGAPGSVSNLPSEPSAPTGTGASFATSVAAPLEALRVQEINRTRAFLRLSFALAVLVSAFVPFVGGDPLARWVLLGGMAAVVASTAWLTWMLRTDEGYTVARAIACAYVCMAGAFGGIYFFGVFSPAPMILPFGLFFFGAAQSFRATLSVYLTCAAAYATLALLVAFGAFADRGLVVADHATVTDRALVVVIVEIVLLATYLIARASRAATLDAITRHDKAVRSLAQREALLREARADLERALKFGGIGRFTDTQLGSFRLGKVLGRGGMGEVYEATHVSSHEAAAVKLLHAHVLADADLVRRFMREAKIAAALDTPNVVRVLEVGGLEAPVPFLAMERLRGEDLADLLRRQRQLTPKRTVGLVREVGRGLAAARKAGIVHRDLKPRNLFYAEDAMGRRAWKILDFGVSKLADAEGTHTKDMLIGTPAYMSPEQASGAAVTYKTDLYALGVIAYRALTGRPAFTGEGTAETLFQVVYTMPPRPSAVARLHPAFDAVLAVAMAKDPDVRFDSGEELAQALEAATHGEIEQALRDRADAATAKNPWAETA